MVILPEFVQKATGRSFCIAECRKLAGEIRPFQQIETEMMDVRDSYQTARAQVLKASSINGKAPAWWRNLASC